MHHTDTKKRNCWKYEDYLVQTVYLDKNIFYLKDLLIFYCGIYIYIYIHIYYSFFYAPTPRKILSTKALQASECILFYWANIFNNTESLNYMHYHKIPSLCLTFQLVEATFTYAVSTIGDL